ncbi:MAG: hypothetical protein HUU34_06900 [Saprospiraceae bacterium]|nr:hypothetical protein [Saprospiraceae bacterium]
MKISILHPLFLFLLVMSSCVSQQEAAEEDMRVQKFLNGEIGNLQTHHTDATSIRGNDPNDMRYMATMTPTGSFMPRQATRIMSQMKKYPFTDAITNWKPMHELAKPAIEEAKSAYTNQSDKMINIELISFFMLDKYLSNVPVNAETASAVNFYLQTLTDEGSKAELYLVCASINKYSSQLSRSDVKAYKTYYSKVINQLLADEAAPELAKSWAITAKSQL